MKFSMKRSIAMILVYIFLFQDTIIYYFNNEIVNILDEIFLLFYGIIALFYCIKNKKVNKVTFSIFIMSIVYFIIGCISGIKNSNYEFFSLLMGGLLMIKTYILVFSVSNVPVSKESLKYIIEALKSAAFVCAAIGIFNFILPSYYLKIFTFGFIDSRMGLPSVMSLFIHPGQFGWFMLFIALYYFSIFIINRNKKKYIFSFFFFALMALLSLKVKVIIGILVVMIVYVFIIEKRKVKFKYILFTVGLISIIWVFFGKLISENYRTYFTQTETISARYALSHTSIDILQDYFPLGVGFAKFGSWFARVNYSEIYYEYGIDNVYGLRPSEPFFATDTFWPVVLGETGFLGMVVYLLILVNIFIKLNSRFKFDKNNFYYLFVLLIFIQALVESMGEQIFNSSPQNIILGFIIGMAMSRRKGYNEKNSILHA